MVQHDRVAIGDAAPRVRLVAERRDIYAERREIPYTDGTAVEGSAYLRFVRQAVHLERDGHCLPPAPLTLEQFTRWYEHRTGAERDVCLTIYQRAGWEANGVAAWDGVDHRHRTAELHMVIGESRRRGQGYGTEAARPMLDYAFIALGLESAAFTVAEFSAAGLRAYEKADFRPFGRRRRCRTIGGTLWDQVCMECLASEFTGARTAL